MSESGIVHINEHDLITLEHKVARVEILMNECIPVRDIIYLFIELLRFGRLIEARRSVIRTSFLIFSLESGSTPSLNSV